MLFSVVLCFNQFMEIKKACASSSPSKVLIPKGILLLSTMTLEGPCKAAIEVEAQGTLKVLTDNKVTKEGS